ncbi:hypothetical protein TM51_13040 [Thermobifida fusca TM51]|uniref:CDP-alcohol phosphatidyltransferase family protein n=1 Tax=Thermobifida fusca TM51 TaxID=1169414 RepID=A0A9P2T9U1_THEFU|nr:hypothetical protein [Thermobifida fusca]EOR70390.1 hypothetical protein TM51_13040 [Thermobifida fusca TM51]
MTETGVLTAYGMRPLAEPVVRWAVRRGTTPAAMARAGAVLTAVAAVWFTDTALMGSLVGTLALALVLYCDAVGSRIAEHRCDALNAWAVAMLSRVREYVLFLGLALGASLAGQTDVWLWVAGALTAHAVRESVAEARAAHRPEAQPRDASRGAPPPIEAIDPSYRSREPADPDFTAELLGLARDPDDTAEPPGTVRLRPAPASQKTRDRGAAPGNAAPPRRRRQAVSRGRAGRLLRDVARFGPSERFLVIAVSVTIWHASVAFGALIAGSVAAMAVATLLPQSDSW